MDNNATQNQYVRHVDYVKICIAAILLMIIAFSIIFAYTKNQKIKIDDIPTPIVKAKENPFEKTQVLATSAIVWDIKNHKIIYAKNAEEILPLASLTKIVSALTASDKISKNTTVRITGEDLMAEGDTGLNIGDKWTLKDLLNLTLVSSSNDGAHAVANAISAIGGSSDENFVNEMNKTVQDIGLSDTHFNNENGLDVDKIQSGGYGSATDVAKLLDYIMRKEPELLEATRFDSLPVTSLNGETKTFNNTNVALPQIPGLLGSKTGYTDLAGGNLAVVVDPGMSGPYAIVVLNSGYDERFTDVETLTKDLLKYLEPNK